MDALGEAAYAVRQLDAIDEQWKKLQTEPVGGETPEATEATAARRLKLYETISTSERGLSLALSQMDAKETNRFIAGLTPSELKAVLVLESATLRGRPAALSADQRSDLYAALVDKPLTMANELKIYKEMADSSNSFPRGDKELFVAKVLDRDAHPGQLGGFRFAQQVIDVHGSLLSKKTDSRQFAEEVLAMDNVIASPANVSNVLVGLHALDKEEQQFAASFISNNARLATWSTSQLKDLAGIYKDNVALVAKISEALASQVPDMQLQ